MAVDCTSDVQVYMHVEIDKDDDVDPSVAFLFPEAGPETTRWNRSSGV